MRSLNGYVYVPNTEKYVFAVALSSIRVSSTSMRDEIGEFATAWS